MKIDPRIVSILISVVPDLISWARVEFMKKNPGVPVPTDEDIFAAYQVALTESLKKDADWLATHPVIE